MPLWDGRETPEEYAERQRRNVERAEEREQSRLAYEERQRDRERRHEEYLQRQRERERKHEEYLQRQREKERKTQEWQERQRQRELQQHRNRMLRQGLIARANVNADSSNWKAGFAEVKELQVEWGAIKYCGEDEDGELRDEFRRHIQKFFDRKTAYFQDLETKQNSATAQRESIIDKAKNACFSPVDWQNTATHLEYLRKEFASCGPFRKGDYESLWSRLNSIITEFHKNWKAHREAERLVRLAQRELRSQRANWPGERFARDIAVNPMPAATLSTARPVGRSPTQNAVKDKWVSYMERKGYENIRVNQRQVTGEGTQVGINRPDLSGNGPHTGDRLNAEFETSKSSRGPEHERRIYANDLKARVVIKRAD